MDNFDMVILGGGPGGYIAAIRAAQLGKKVAIVEQDKLGGVCLNRGCIPTKALLKSAHAIHQLKSYRDLGINIELRSLDSATAIKRASAISERMAKGVAFLMKKNNIKVISGKGHLTRNKQEVEVVGPTGEILTVSAANVVIATGAHYKTFPGLQHDGDRIIGAWEALKMEDLPQTIAIVGAGAIGVELAYFWNSFGVDVHIFEVKTHLLPLEDEESSQEVERAYKKLKIKMSLGISGVELKNKGINVQVKVEEKGKTKEYSFEKCLLAVGMVGNIDELGLEQNNVETTDNGFIKTDQYQRTNIPGLYAIGDVCGGILLAHVASHQGIIAAEHICGGTPHPIEPLNIPACTYSYPQVASVGYSEQRLRAENRQYVVGKAPFRANGKAVASNESDGFVKVLLGPDGDLLGAHIVGSQATELIHEYVLTKTLQMKGSDIATSIHPHPTLGESLLEAVLAAENRALNI